MPNLIMSGALLMIGGCLTARIFLKNNWLFVIAVLFAGIFYATTRIDAADGLKDHCIFISTECERNADGSTKCMGMRSTENYDGTKDLCMQKGYWVKSEKN